ncbi:hypothetical protein EXU30_19745 [Shewanella maritima]|uniref:Uncharacterized protein n=1 Tax=Shewanella maritima TaxID=2520507 RepID=A0A411PMD5_9GAMM|nr:hypothetical protein [Shewanella maritima]QBF84659.1 hypothetical protein EXU30_19745 [Shewanella maritima]
MKEMTDKEMTNIYELPEQYITGADYEDSHSHNMSPEELRQEIRRHHDSYDRNVSMQRVIKFVCMSRRVYSLHRFNHSIDMRQFGKYEEARVAALKESVKDVPYPERLRDYMPQEHKGVLHGHVVRDGTVFKYVLHKITHANTVGHIAEHIGTEVASA